MAYAVHEIPEGKVATLFINFETGMAEVWYPPLDAVGEPCGSDCRESVLEWDADLQHHDEAVKEAAEFMRCREDQLHVETYNAPGPLGCPKGPPGDVGPLGEE